MDLGGNENPGDKSELKREGREARVLVLPARQLRPRMSVKGGERNRLVGPNTRDRWTPA